MMIVLHLTGAAFCEFHSGRQVGYSFHSIFNRTRRAKLERKKGIRLRRHNSRKFFLLTLLSTSDLTARL
jgi:hypothetical protein